MREYLVLRDAIQNLGASVVEEHLHPEVFGSAYCIFAGHNGTQFRLVWDGKEGYGFLQSAKSPDLWEDVDPRIYGVSSPNAPKFLELLSIAKAFIHGSATVG